MLDWFTLLKVSLLMKLEVSCFPCAPKRPRLKRPLMLEERFGRSKKSWWFTLTPRSLFFLEKCWLNSFHILLSLTPRFEVWGITYSALPETLTRIGSPVPPPDFRLSLMPAPAGACTDEERPYLPDFGDARLLSAPGWKKEVPNGVEKAAAWSLIVGIRLVKVAGYFWNKISFGVVGFFNIS